MEKFYSTLINLKIGDRIVVPKSNIRLIQHHAIFLGLHNGQYMFIENKEGFGVRIASAQTFFIDVNEITRIVPFIPVAGYSRKDLSNYALSKKGKLYDLLKYNCEHFANDVQHRFVKSKQRDTGVVLGAVALGLLLVGLFKSK